MKRHERALAASKVRGRGVPLTVATLWNWISQETVIIQGFEFWHRIVIVSQPDPVHLTAMHVHT